MLYAISQIIRDTRMKLGLNPQAQPALILCDEQLTVDQKIKASIIEAVTAAHLAAPAHWLQNAKAWAPQIAWEGDELHGYAPLPDDWLRLACFRMSDWQQAAVDAITAADPAYALQRCAYPGLRGTPERPVCAIAPERRLEFYSCRSQQATVALALYMPIPAIIDDAIDIAPLCYPQIISALSSTAPPA